MSGITNGPQAYPTEPGQGVPVSDCLPHRQPGVALSGDSQALVEKLVEQSSRRALALAAAAHELKTPLAIVAGYVDLLLSEKAGLLNPRQRSILEESRTNCARLHRFINDFLTYGSLEAGKWNISLQEADLNACLAEVCDIWLPRFQSKQIALYLRQNTALAPFFFDYHKVQHLVSNLLENGLKFTPAGGTVWVSAEPYIWERRSLSSAWRWEERRRGASVANAARVIVADTGPGIPPEYHQEIFEDFFKLPGPDGEGGGTGLGLAIARRLALAHNGKIWVESELGAGSRFCLLLPLKRT